MQPQDLQKGEPGEAHVHPALYTPAEVLLENICLNKGPSVTHLVDMLRCYNISLFSVLSKSVLFLVVLCILGNLFISLGT